MADLGDVIQRTRDRPVRRDAWVAAGSLRAALGQGSGAAGPLELPDVISRPSRPRPHP